MKNIILILILAITISTVGAEIMSLPDVTKNNCTQLTQSHPNATSINITKIRFPNGTEDYTIKIMSSINGFNYNYTFCNTNSLGKYIITTCGNGDGVKDCLDYDFEVKREGDIRGNTLNVVIWLSAFVLIAVGFIFRKTAPLYNLVGNVLIGLNGILGIYVFNNPLTMIIMLGSLVFMFKGFFTFVNRTFDD